ncbi:hypothetical protein PHMEG_0009073 [Phytophthora megakarya]|uniref:Uncharacterized protein n=1 Tax=Phytophthora megakarya TaxID=4795 RepID=A0A225WIU4_9STRA|nr:hypothetical protein PHMEG_0009073 [Phytophthora megakarya]
MQGRIGSAHNIPLIQRLFKGLGGCAKAGQIFWRLEAKLALLKQSIVFLKPAFKKIK